MSSGGLHHRDWSLHPDLISRIWSRRKASAGLLRRKGSGVCCCCVAETLVALEELKLRGELTGRAAFSPGVPPESCCVERSQPEPANMKWMFKEDHSLEHRCIESAKIHSKYPDRVPVIVEKVSGSQIVDIDKRKYLVPSDITVAQFMWIIRKRIKLPSENAIFLFVDKTVPQSSITMGQLYDKEKDEDGFLYMAYSGENTFGV
ncbi:gamma-aminobutyric acid receptor-associated protein-like 2 [Nematolebias whitei]|uniref:gamma-aminobutyric acid receptor-associated protein-like 2 n=1 Tax=Nematolebias whitei TaxID=451745 RepID=UPI00189BF36A|nr:gamma-aminobutyric acid receptor-associated protein-like 2 [Nematolebias whitei]